MSQEFNIGTKIEIALLPAYFKTADPMPMLRPPTFLALGTTGLITARQPGNYWVVKFDRGSFLLEAQYMRIIDE